MQFCNKLEKEPFYRTKPKDRIWKGTYHTGRTLMNCIKMLADDNFSLMKTSEGFRKEKNSFGGLIRHWEKVAKDLA